jgi:3-deoxy-D-manno-octulosonic acid kinase
MRVKHFFLHRDGVVVNPRIFDPAYLSRDSEIAAKEKVAGRGAVVFFQHENHALVLRHYHRGGLPARFSPDKYFWTGLERTRAWREYNLLKFIQSCDLPAPRVYAARIKKRGLFYTGDIITHRIKGTDSLGERLATERLSKSNFERIGATIGRFHNNMIDHVDLNADNLLLDENYRVYLIDFDRCRIRRAGNVDWRQDNLQRLRRSLDKKRKGADTFNFSDADWASLCAGYRKSQSSSK